MGFDYEILFLKKRGFLKSRMVYPGARRNFFNRNKNVPEMRNEAGRPLYYT